MRTTNLRFAFARRNTAFLGRPPRALLRPRRTSSRTPCAWANAISTCRHGAVPFGLRLRRCSVPDRTLYTGVSCPGRMNDGRHRVAHAYTVAHPYKDAGGSSPPSPDFGTTVDVTPPGSYPSHATRLWVTGVGGAITWPLRLYFVRLQATPAPCHCFQERLRCQELQTVVAASSFGSHQSNARRPCRRIIGFEPPRGNVVAGSPGWKPERRTSFICRPCRRASGDPCSQVLRPEAVVHGRVVREAPRVTVSARL